MTGYHPFAEYLALLAALEDELLAAPDAELQAATDDAARIIAAALDDDALPQGLLPPGAGVPRAVGKTH